MALALVRARAAAARGVAPQAWLGLLGGVRGLASHNGDNGDDSADAYPTTPWGEHLACCCRGHCCAGQRAAMPNIQSAARDARCQATLLDCRLRASS